MFIEQLENIWSGIDYPFLQDPEGNKLFFKEIIYVAICDLEKIQTGDVVALIGDFDSKSIATLLKLLSKGAIVVPLTKETRNQHE